MINSSHLSYAIFKIKQTKEIPQWQHVTRKSISMYINDFKFHSSLIDKEMHENRNTHSILITSWNAKG